MGMTALQYTHLVIYIYGFLIVIAICIGIAALILALKGDAVLVSGAGILIDHGTISVDPDKVMVKTVGAPLLIENVNVRMEGAAHVGGTLTIG